MENNEAMDPLEKMMEELDSSTSAPNISTTPPTELPHRPIVLPPEIKEEPYDNLVNVTQGNDKEISLLKQPIRIKKEPEDNQVNKSQVISQLTEDPSDQELMATQVFSHSTEVSLPKQSVEINQKAAALTATEDTDSAQQPQNDSSNEPTGNVGETIEITSHIQANLPNNSQNTSPDMPNTLADSDINVSKEISSITTNIEETANKGPECSQPAYATVSSSEAPIRVKTEMLEDGELPDEQSSNESVTANQNKVPTENVPINEVTTWIKPEPIENGVDIVHSNSTFMAEKTLETSNNANIMPTASNDNQVSEAAAADETLPDNFFDDLLQNADIISEAALQVNASSKTPEQLSQAQPSEMLVKKEPIDNTTVSEPTQSAHIPENFFDDLLVDRVAERVEDVVNHDLELKYSERLKELEKLEGCLSNKAHKKHKKKKKKSHKRSHAEATDVDDSMNGQDKHKRSKRNSRSPNESINAQIIQSPMRIRVKNEFATPSVPTEIINLVDEEPTTSAAAKAVVRAGRIRIKSELATFPMKEAVATDIPDLSLPVRENELFQRRSNYNRNGVIVDMTTPLGFKRIKLEKDVEKVRKACLPENKILVAKQRAIHAIEVLKSMSNSESDTLTSLIYTPTVRKLPKSSCYFKQQIYENRSPLHNVNNVSYKFNSHANHFNLYEWGLEEMPRYAAKVAKPLGFSIYALAKKLETFKIPLKLQKIKKEFNEELEEKMLQNKSSFLTTVATQTKEVTVLESASERFKNAHHIGIQVDSQRNTVATQTSGFSKSSYDDLPLMRQISILNENQLIALGDFVDLICEPAPELSAIDLYNLRQRLMQIYKCSQEPSALEIAATARQQLQQQLQQQQPQQTINMRDPRNRVRAALTDEEPPPPPPAVINYRQAQHQPVRMVWPANQRPTVMTQTIPVISNVQSYHPSSDSLPASTLEPSTSRYYGRGGMRR